MYPLRDDPRLSLVWKRASPMLKRKLYHEYYHSTDTKPSAIRLLDQENKLLLAQLEHYRQEVRELKAPTIAVSARKGRDKPRGKPRKSLPAGQVLPASGVCIQVP